MPHVVIKMIKGPSVKQQEEAAKKIRDVLEETMGKPGKYVSVSVEEYSFNEWEGVYDACIKDNKNVVLKPGYTNPVTFS
ncbi:MAG: 4-oxalocrotonate tautomerase family protein [Clostridia bacterium]|nr:4-oxalocrotonate tautomerase family protein [Clostridia bacterium]